MASQQVHLDKDDHGGACLNCGATLSGAFCHQCGQRAHVHKSLLHLGEEVLHGVLHFDAKGWRTLPMLVLHPGELTRRYIDGHRTRFVSPLALFLFMVFFMFFVGSLTRSGDTVSLVNKPAELAEARKELGEERIEAAKLVAKAEAELEKVRSSGGDLSPAQVRLGEAHGELASVDKRLKVLEMTGHLTKDNAINVGGFKADTGWPAADAALTHAAANPDLTIYKLKNAGAKLSFLLVPISLPFLWLLFFWRRGVTMYDHAVFSLYSLSFMSLMFAAMFLLNFVGLTFLLPWIGMLAPPAHMFVQLRGAYNLTRRQAFWRTVALLLIAFVVFALYLTIILIMSMR